MSECLRSGQVCTSDAPGEHTLGPKLCWYDERVDVKTEKIREREGQEEMRSTDVSRTEMEQAGTGRQLGPSQVTRGITRVSGHPKRGGIIWAKASNILGVGLSEVQVIQ